MLVGLVRFTRRVLRRPNPCDLKYVEEMLSRSRCLYPVAQMGIWESDCRSNQHWTFVAQSTYQLPRRLVKARKSNTSSDF